ncbi:family 43 glycosylhydrolase [Mucilaginibacter sp. RS28]|uniref:Family 43 glycosylhydrolase n=1 Tax=Mucilaginibacter straminoryzae TaxID=2932774 RepID=A0A9X1WZP8_9SPHI|nr:family 43 glycosylhydrolase [Mucilaginibacter straminoryzae]MCJ8208602.1 family 43 glycosylhydrolase [Mucilaginibacter straminoryzae]
MKFPKSSTLFCAISCLFTLSVKAQNPLITNQFTADPSARVFGDSVYIYPSHDILARPGHGRVGWFCMEDYHVFSSANLTEWKDQGAIVSQTTVPWADSTAYSMWAPDCIYRKGKYYFYFPATAKASEGNRGFSIGVAVADKPYGPFIPQTKPIAGVHGIDPNVFIDKDGQAYLYWAQGNIYGAKLKENMLELASEPQILKELPEKGLKEGPYLFERNGTYYLTYPHAANKTERLEYATSNSPLGPFKFTGVIMDESPSGCWTNHQSIIKFRNQWYLFYHDDQLSPKFDKSRSIRADSLFFNSDGTIQKVIPTLRGIGITPAGKEIQVDRYSAISQSGVSVDFIDTAHTMKGWKVMLSNPGAWVRYNKVDFGKGKFNTLKVSSNQKNQAIVELYADKMGGAPLATIELKEDTDWQITAAKLNARLKGTHDLFLVLKGEGPVAIDWIKFE